MPSPKTSMPPATATTSCCTNRWAQAVDFSVRELGVAHAELERPAVDAAELVVDEPDSGLVSQAELGERSPGSGLLVDHPDLDGATRRLDRLGGELAQGGAGRCAADHGRFVAFRRRPVESRLPGRRLLRGLLAAPGGHQSGEHDQDTRLRDTRRCMLSPRSPLRYARARVNGVHLRSVLYHPTILDAISDGNRALLRRLHSRPMNFAKSVRRIVGALRRRPIWGPSAHHDRRAASVAR